MKLKNKIMFGMILLLVVVFMSSTVLAAYMRSGVQYIQPGISGIGFGGYERTECGEVGQDFMVQISPLGCSPSVVRSDLLEEQSVPVFCKVDIVKINPLIDVNQIESVKFEGETNQYVSGVSFHPNREAIYTRQGIIDNPFINDVGYVVVLSITVLVIITILATVPCSTSTLTVACPLSPFWSLTIAVFAFVLSVPSASTTFFIIGLIEATL